MSIHEVFPYLRIDDGRGAEALALYAEAFGATERLRLVDPGDGRVGHAELVVGAHVIMVSDAYPEMGLVGPKAIGGHGGGLHLHVDDADAVIAKMVALGCTVVRPASDQFYGERSGTVEDPFGHMWMVGHEIEQVTPEEMQRRWDAM